MAPRTPLFWRLIDLPRLGLDRLAAALCWLASLVARRSFCRDRYLGPLHRRSAALRGALLRTGTIRAVPEISDPTRAGYELEVSIRPREQTARWSVADLWLVAPGALPKRPELDCIVGEILSTSVWRNGRFRRCVGRPRFRGTQRLKFRIHLQPGTRHFRFRYFLELLGHRPSLAPATLVRRQGNTSTLRGSAARPASSPPRDVSARTAPVAGRTAAPSTGIPRARVDRPSALDALTRPHYPAHSG
jgi:hypothetical protein